MPLPYSNYHDGASSQPVEVVKRESEEPNQEYDSLEVAAEDLCRAVDAKDYKAIAMALRAAYELLESESFQFQEESNG